MAEKSQYTDPELRDRLKEQIQAGDRGGRPGQWSARKAQLLASEYRKAGGDYTSGKANESEGARHLDQWTDEEWQTKDGSARARSGSETARYLPKEAWDELSSEARDATDQRKRSGSRQGTQFVPNTTGARDAGKKAREHDDEPFTGYDSASAKDVLGRLRDLDAETLRAVRSYERKHAERKTILERVDRALER